MSIMQPGPAPMPPAPQSPAPQPQAPPHATPSVDPKHKQLLTDEEFQKLKEKVNNSYQRLEPHRNVRLSLIRQYVAGSFGNSGAAGDQQSYEALVNMLDQMVEVYLQKLVSGNPKALILTQKTSLKTAARYFQMALNHVIEKIDLRESMAFAVLESMFSMAILKVGVEVPEHTARNYPFDASAIPFVDAVFFENWVHDTAVDRWELITFCGDRYRERKELIESDPRNNKKGLEGVDAQSGNAFQSNNNESAENLSSVPEVYEGDKDYYRLWDIYVPHKRLLVTYVDGASSPLRVVPWTGPPNGPYRIGRYKLVPNNIMPKPPAMDVAPIADLENRIWLKMGEQASRQKTITFAPLGAGRDAQTIIKASDGDVVNVTHGDGVRQAKYGGVEQENITFASIVHQKGSYEGGNIDTMGGLGTQADTLGQEELLSQSSNDRIRARQNVIITLSKGVLFDVGWYLWNDPLVRITVTDKIPNTDMELEVKWPMQDNGFGQEIDMRQGEYNDFNFDIEPYSMTDQPPGVRAQQLRSILQQDVLPMMQLMMQQGISIDLEEYLMKLSVYLNLPELVGILRFLNAPPDSANQMVNEGPPKAANTTRQYERVVKPPGGRGGMPMPAGPSVPAPRAPSAGVPMVS